MPAIAVIPGDGIGNEVIPEAVKVLETLNETTGMSFEYELFDYGAERYLRTGEATPDNILEIMKETAENFDAVLFGAGGIDYRVPLGKDAKPITKSLRLGLDLYANHRPCRLYDARLTPLKNKNETDINMAVFRECTEGHAPLLGGIFKKGTPDEVNIRDEIHTRKGVERIIKYAFEYAKKHQLSRVTMSEKTGPDGIWRRVYGEVSKDYPEIEAHHLHFDALACHMVLMPEHFQVIVIENRIGDIISDLAGALHGGLGLSPSGVFNAEKKACYFEPVHGTAPDIAGRNVANPFASILAVRMMLEHLGFQDPADLIDKAVLKAIKDGKTTKDIGGSLSTQQVGEFVCKTIRQLSI